MQIIENFSDEHNDYFTLTDDNKAEYEWHKRKGSTMSTEAILFLIRKREYPDCPDQKKVDLETMAEWIKDGCMLRDKEGKYIDKAEKILWKGTHPIPTRAIDGEKLSDDTMKEYNDATTIKSLKIVLKKILKGHIRQI